MRRVAVALLVASAACSPTPPTLHPQPHGSASADEGSGGAPSTTIVSSSSEAATTSASSSSGAGPVVDDPVPSPERIDVPQEIKTVLDNYDRAAEDKAEDAGRQPGMTLAFFGVSTGQQIAEILPGDGYFVEVFARTVGPTGKVYGVNNKAVLEKRDAAWTARLKRPQNRIVVRLDRELDAPFPADVKDLDLVVIVQSYHDLYWLGYDRAAMNKAIFAALKPGGKYGVVDHVARKGEGTSQVKTLHRIEPSELRKDIEAAGFVFDAEATFLRNPRDTKDWSANDSGQENRGTTDRVVYRFKKP
ncbi:MAG: SAM-dependent methyltransferase [Polyangiaceae bacterium]